MNNVADFTNENILIVFVYNCFHLSDLKYYFPLSLFLLLIFLTVENFYASSYLHLKPRSMLKKSMLCKVILICK